MSCVLRAWGKNFDVETFLQKSKLKPIAIWKRGQKFKRKIRGRKSHRDSGFNCEVSEKDFDQFNAQIRDAIDFMKFLKKDLKRLTAFPGVEKAGLDFGITNRALSDKKILVQSDAFPAELAKLAGSLGLDIAMTLYPPSFSFLNKKSKK
jgi:hypothetical protein